MRGSRRKLGISVENGVWRIYTIIVPGVMIADEHGHKSFDRMYNPQDQVHKELASAAADLFELTPGAISGRVIRDEVNDSIHHARLQWVANSSFLCGYHSTLRAFLSYHYHEVCHRTPMQTNEPNSILRVYLLRPPFTAIFLRTSDCIYAVSI